MFQKKMNNKQNLNKKRLRDKILLASMLIGMLCAGFGFGEAYSNLKINKALVSNGLALCQPQTGLFNTSMAVRLNTKNISEFMEIAKIKADWIKCSEVIAFGDDYKGWDLYLNKTIRGDNKT
jgi:hypothetical protein